MNTVHKKARKIKGIFENGEQSELCGPFLPEMFLKKDKDSYCNFTEYAGYEWYCQKPVNSTDNFSDFDCGKKIIWNGNHEGKFYLHPHWTMKNTTIGLKLDDVYESLIFEQEINIVKNEKMPENLPNSFTETPGYWNNYIWHDRIFPNSPKNSDKGLFLTNTTFIKMGDSIMLQIGDAFVKGTINHNHKLRYDYMKQPHHKAAERSHEFMNHLFEKTGFDYNFLGFEDIADPACEPWGTWGATLTNWRGSNTSMVTVTEGQPVNKDQCASKTINSVEVINRMTQYGWHAKNVSSSNLDSSHKRHIILFTHGAHFASWHPIVFYNRLIAIRNSIINYKKSANYQDNSIFIYKTPNYVRGNFTKLYAIVSGFEMYRMREISFKVFGNPYQAVASADDKVENYMNDDRNYPVKVYDSFAPTFAAFGSLEPGNIHPPGFLLETTSDQIVDLVDLYH